MTNPQERREAVARVRARLAEVRETDDGTWSRQAMFVPDDIGAILSGLDAIPPQPTDDEINWKGEWEAVCSKRIADAALFRSLSFDLEKCATALNLRDAEIARLQALTPKEGFVVVPVEPTEDMLDAGDEPFHAELRKQRLANEKAGRPLAAFGSGPVSEAIYRAMLSAAPLPITGEGE